MLRPEKTAALQLYKSHVHAMDEYLWELFQKYYGTKGVVRWAPPGDDVTLVAYGDDAGNLIVSNYAHDKQRLLVFPAHIGLSLSWNEDGITGGSWNDEAKKIMVDHISWPPPARSRSPQARRRS